MSSTSLSATELWSLCKLGHQLYTRDRFDDAATIFEGIVALDESLGYAWHALGLIARKRSNPDRAVDCFQRRLELEPEAAESRVQLAETLRETGDRQRALRLLEYLTDSPDDSEAARRGRVLLERWR